MNRMIAVLIVVGMASAIGANARAEHGPKPLRRAHAHNDYLQVRPLRDALAHGFCSVEADIFLVDGELLVAHTLFELRQGQTLEALYLEPLQKRIVENGGRVYRDGPQFTLLIDIKSDGEATYGALRKTLTRYADMLTRVVDDEEYAGAIQIVISGNRPKEMIVAESTRLAGIDGRLSDLDSNAPSHLVPLISDRWTSNFQWRGNGPIPDAEREKLKRIVSKAHEHGRRVRFWATPESESLWKELAGAGVDLINTDDLPRLQAFLKGSD